MVVGAGFSEGASDTQERYSRNRSHLPGFVFPPIVMKTLLAIISLGVLLPAAAQTTNSNLNP